MAAAALAAASGGAEPASTEVMKNGLVHHTTNNNSSVSAFAILSGNGEMDGVLYDSRRSLKSTEQPHRSAPWRDPADSVVSSNNRNKSNHSQNEIIVTMSPSQPEILSLAEFDNRAHGGNTTEKTTVSGIKITTNPISNSSSTTTKGNKGKKCTENIAREEAEVQNVCQIGQVIWERTSNCTTLDGTTSSVSPTHQHQTTLDIGNSKDEVVAMSTKPTIHQILVTPRPTSHGDFNKTAENMTLEEEALVQQADNKKGSDTPAGSDHQRGYVVGEKNNSKTFLNPESPQSTQTCSTSAFSNPSSINSGPSENKDGDAVDVSSSTVPRQDEQHEGVSSEKKIETNDLNVSASQATVCLSTKTVVDQIATEIIAEDKKLRKLWSADDKSNKSSTNKSRVSASTAGDITVTFADSTHKDKENRGTKLTTSSHSIQGDSISSSASRVWRRTRRKHLKKYQDVDDNEEDDHDEEDQEKDTRKNYISKALLHGATADISTHDKDGKRSSASVASSSSRLWRRRRRKQLRENCGVDDEEEDSDHPRPKYRHAEVAKVPSSRRQTQDERVSLPPSHYIFQKKSSSFSSVENDKHEESATRLVVAMSQEADVVHRIEDGRACGDNDGGCGHEGDDEYSYYYVEESVVDPDDETYMDFPHTVPQVCGSSSYEEEEVTTQCEMPESSHHDNYRAVDKDNDEDVIHDAADAKENEILRKQKENNDQGAFGDEGSMLSSIFDKATGKSCSNYDSALAETGQNFVEGDETEEEIEVVYVDDDEAEDDDEDEEGVEGTEVADDSSFGSGYTLEAKSIFCESDVSYSQYESELYNTDDDRGFLDDDDDDHHSKGRLTDGGNHLDCSSGHRPASLFGGRTARTRHSVRRGRRKLQHSSMH